MERGYSQYYWPGEFATGDGAELVVDNVEDAAESDVTAERA